jgi:HD-like signal output (HDOD) protein
MKADSFISPRAVTALEFKVPPMPQTLLRAIELMNEDADVASVLTLVESDPAVAARVLRISNSAFAAQRSEILSIRRAIVVLGPSSVLGLVMSMGMVEMRGAFDDETAPPFLDIVRHSIMTAIIARMIVDDVGGSADDQAMAFAAGLLHDLGKLVLLYSAPTQAAPVYRRRLASGETLMEEERALDTNHLRMGGAAADRLRLPMELRAVMVGHSDAEGPDDELVSVIRKANRIAHYLDQRAAGTNGTSDTGTAADSATEKSAENGLWISRAAEIERYVSAIV